MNWKIAEAEHKFSELIRSTIKEPQLIFNSDHLVAVVIEPEVYKEFLVWRERQSNMAEELKELQKFCVEDNYTLFVPSRQNRSGVFTETHELSI
jgi:hypothetical protein